MFEVVNIVLVLMITGVPTAVIGFAIASAGSAAILVLTLVSAPLTFAILFELTAGTSSLPFQTSIYRGQFRRDLSNRAYRNRRLYGACWNAIYYFVPVYWLLLAIAPLRRLLFTLFGYRGDLHFSIQPDCWIRDLPLLSIGDGTYLANKATLGSNVCLNNGTILVDRIELGKNSMAGHLAILGPGSALGEGSELGVGAALGIRSRVGDRTNIKGRASISHGVRIGNRCDIGGHACIGLRSEIRDGIYIPEGAVVPAGTVLSSQEDVENLLSAERTALRHARLAVAHALRDFSPGESATQFPMDASFPHESCNTLE